MKIFVPLMIIISVFLFSCKNKVEKKPGFTVKGNLDHAINQKLYLAELTPNGMLIKDSAKVDQDGNFRISGYLSEPSVMLLYRSPEDPVKLIIDTADQIIINGDLANLAGSVKISGTGPSLVLDKMQKHLYNNLLMLDSLNFVYKTSQGLPNFDTILIELGNSADSLINNERQFLINHIENNPGSLTSYVALTQQFGAQNFIFDPVKDLKYFEMVEKGLKDEMPNSKITLGLTAFIDEMKDIANSGSRDNIELKKGMYAPEISLKNSNDELVALSSLKGKYVLLVFWATWCKPCRMENPVYVRLYNKYKASRKGFDIYQVSVDRPEDKDKWIKMVKADNIFEWTNVFDEKQMYEAKYAIESIPLNFLLDQNGQIIEKNLRGIELENKLREIFNY